MTVAAQEMDVEGDSLIAKCFLCGGYVGDDWRYYRDTHHYLRSCGMDTWVEIISGSE